jgi:putative transposase
LVTRRCGERKFYLRASKLSGALFLYALANAAKRTHMDVIGYVVMSNHYHLVVYDRYANISAFTHHLNLFVAKSFNLMLGRGENFWATDSMCSVELVNREDIVSKLAYTLANPVQAGLVGRARSWEGVTSWHAMKDKSVVSVARPKLFYSKCMPARAELKLALDLPGLGGREKFVADVVAEVERLRGVARASASWAWMPCASRTLMTCQRRGMRCLACGRRSRVEASGIGLLRCGGTLSLSKRTPLRVPGCWRAVPRLVLPLISRLAPAPCGP